MRVLKVMFTAIVTAMLGLAGLESVGLLDMSLVAVPPAYLMPALVGGLLVGVGFHLSGYCPGTSVVAAASGNFDGLFALGGIVIGSVGFGFAYPLLESFYNSSPLETVRFTDLLGIPAPILAAGVLVMAVGVFVAAERVEVWAARREGTEPPEDNPRARKGVFAALAVVAVIGLVGMALPAPPVPDEAAVEPARIAAVDLAQAVVREDPMHLVDLRAEAACQKRTIPGAVCVPEGGDTRFLATLPPTRPLVLFDDGGKSAVPGEVRGFEGRVLVLDGGYAAFQAQVLALPTPPTDGAPDTLAAYRLRSELHGHFTGARSAPQPVKLKVHKVRRASKPGGGC